jgi:23S rRNA (cytosine1962-C5)-methyltransferase
MESMAKLEELRPLRSGAEHAQGPAVVVTRRATERLRDGSVWVYRSEVEQVLPAPATAAVEGGSVVTVMDGRGIAVGSALFSSASQITLRMVSSTVGLSREAYLEDVAERVGAAVDLREELAPESEENNACRLIFSEADRLPGIVADRYGDLVILQMLTQGTARDDVREVIARVLSERLQPATIAERPDARISKVEELGESPAEPLYARGAEAKLKTVFTINGLKFAYDATAGQKTGAFLDQRLNYAAAATRSRGKALDICTYQGGFALHLARTCERVTGVDASRTALEVADGNLELNAGKISAKVDWMEADAFDLLREYEAAGRRYDTIVLDPPAFAKSKRALEGAMRGYKEMNLRALKMLEPGGTLVTCSCSQHLSLAEFQAMVASAAADAKRRVQVLEIRGAAPDHPAIVTLPETSYLKCLVCRVD